MPYMTAAEVKARSSALAAVDDDVIERLVAEFEEIFEDYRGYSPIPRTVTETVWMVHNGILLLRWPFVRSVTTLEVDGTEVLAENYQVDLALGAVGYPGGYWGSGATEITYEHGKDGLSAIELRACVEYVERTNSADNSGTSRDIISQSYDGGFTRYATPDKAAGRPTGWLEVDRLLNSLEDHRVPGVH